MTKKQEQATVRDFFAFSARQTKAYQFFLSCGGFFV
jgi:hypothetical protein